MNVAYFDCCSGAAGDMILGALVGAGLPMKRLTGELGKLPLGQYRIVRRRGKDFAGVNLHVEVKEEPRHSDYKSLDAMIAGSKLERGVTELARDILRRLAVAEGRVHGRPVERVHFHEVGATDSLVDIVGAAIGFAHFKFSSIHSSPLPMSRGSVSCAHGELPVPAPATLELLKGVPLEGTKVKGELVTPTGAAILTAVTSHFGECPLQKIQRVGVGFGDADLPGRPNILRLMIGEGFRVAVMEADIDDMNPELYGHATERLFAAGAVDVSLAAVQMKKGRPGTRVSCVVPWGLREGVADVMLAETTTFGVRYWPAERRVLTRELKTQKIKRNKITLKVGRDACGKVVKAVPEYESVRRLARKSGRPIAELYAEALGTAAGFIDRRIK